jgi:lysozyme family protein
MFERAVEVVLQHEGGYSDHPADEGGATNYGISSAAHPDEDIAELTEEQAVEIYWTEYWVPGHYEMLPERLAIKVFDLAVNMGRHPAVTLLQQALRACGSVVDADGMIGPQTAGAATATCEIALLAAVRSEAAGYYRLLLQRKPSFAPFTMNWLARAYD